MIPERLRGRSFVYSLFLGEMLTRRGEAGPLGRLWIPARRPRRPKPSTSGAAKPDRTGD